MLLVMFLGVAFLAAALSSPKPAPPAPTLYRIELAGQETIWSQDRPQETGGLLLFHRYPGGVLMSIKKSDVRRFSEAAFEPLTSKALRPGGQIELGPTGGEGGRRSASGGAGAATGSGPRQLGEGKRGTALFNPDRPYRPDWDTKQVPGLNLGLPNSPNDYREGRTLAYPPASVAPPAPGQPPMMPPGTGEVPRGPK